MRCPQLWRSKQLEYTWLRALMGRHADFWQVTGDALDYALARTGVDPAVREPLMQAYLALDAYPEVPDVLRRLRDGGLRTAILSNGEPRMLAAAATSAGIGGAARCDPLGRGGRDLQAASEGLPAGARPPGGAAARDRLPVLERLGRVRRRGLRPAHGVDQPPGHAAGAPAWRSRARAARPVRTACPARAVNGSRRPSAAGLVGGGRQQ